MTDRQVSGTNHGHVTAKWFANPQGDRGDMGHDRLYAINGDDKKSGLKCADTNNGDVWGDGLIGSTQLRTINGQVFLRARNDVQGAVA